MDAFDQMASTMSSADEVWRIHPAYYTFEPWDVGPRSDAVLRQSAEDGADLMGLDVVRCVGRAPYAFQTGYLLSTHFVRVMLAGNQIGKSLAVLFDLLISATGEVPLSLRYPAGHDTGVKRVISAENVRRWGRHSKDTGLVLDHNEKARPDGSWDCGNVMGVGVFPREKIVPPGSMIRLASYDAIIKQVWWPALKGTNTQGLAAFMPRSFIDSKRGASGNKGFNEQDKTAFLMRGVTIQVLTYEAEKKGFEGAVVPTYLDEEPPKEDILAAVYLHTTRVSLSETPWRGITYTKELAFPTTISPQKKTFHATVYDCPYKTEADIANMRSELESKSWEIGARLWGLPTSHKDRPYYDRKKVTLWLQRFRMPFRLVRFVPVEEYNGIRTNPAVTHLPGLMDVEVRMEDASVDDHRSVWKLYEDVIDGAGYASASDQADGADLSEEAGDFSACSIGRQSDEDPTEPVLAATLRSTLPTVSFTREVLHACRYFNNAMLAPESSRGAANEAFTLTAREWPYWFMDIVERQAGRQNRNIRGFCPTTDRRETVFNTLIRNWLDRFNEDEYPNCPDEAILQEAAAAIIGKTRGGTPRCDHSTGGTIDSLMAYGILRFVMQASYNKQIRARSSGREGKKLSWLDSALRATADHRDVSAEFLGKPVHAGR